MKNPADDPIAARLALAEAIAHEGGAMALGYFRDRGRLAIDTKTNGQDVVSTADREIELFLRARITAAFPQDGIMGEEYGVREGSSGFNWVMDPIDGTSPFVFGIPAWCVSIAVTSLEMTVAGVIYAPCTEELFSASQGGGARLNGQALMLGGDVTLSTGVVGLGANHRVPSRLIAGFAERLLDGGGMFIRNGSGALMLAYVAAGRLVAFYEPHMNAWDCLAGLHIIREAGGWTADFPGGSHLLEGGAVIAAAPGIEKELTRLIEARPVLSGAA